MRANDTAYLRCINGKYILMFGRRVTLTLIFTISRGDILMAYCQINANFYSRHEIRIERSWISSNSISLKTGRICVLSTLMVRKYSDLLQKSAARDAKEEDAAERKESNLYFHSLAKAGLESWIDTIKILYRMDDAAKYNKVNYLTHCRDANERRHCRLNIDVSRFRFQTRWTLHRNRDKLRWSFWRPEIIWYFHISKILRVCNCGTRNDTWSLL